MFAPVQRHATSFWFRSDVQLSFARDLNLYRVVTAKCRGLPGGQPSAAPIKQGGNVGVAHKFKKISNFQIYSI